MKLKSLNLLRTACAVSMVAALAACGGGGGSTPAAGGGSGGTGGTGPVVASTGTLHATAAASTYGAGSLEASAFSALNTARAAAGAGEVNQDAKIDTAAAAHALYVHTNIADGVVHTEDSTKPDFYATNPPDRLAKAGFSAGFSTEVIGGTGASLQGSDCVLGLLDTVYHAAALLSKETTVGMGFNTDAAGVPMCVIDLATAATDQYGQVMPAGALTLYPYSGQTNVADTFWVGYESPRPSVTLFPNQTAGTPVLVNVANADYVNDQAAGTLNATVTEFTLKDSGGNLVPAQILAGSALNAGAGVTLNLDGELPASFAVLVPLSPLTKGQTYTASFSVTMKSGATPVAKTWSFTTNP